MFIDRRFRAIAECLCLLVSLFVFASTAGADSSKEGASPARPARGYQAEPHTFEAADGRRVEAELGRFWVPENRRTGSDRTIELAFVRFPSTAKRPGPPIVYLAGGPGGSGIATARGSRFDLFQALRERADVIAFDQRGTGSSEGLPGCSRGWDVPLSEAATRARLESAVREAAAFCAKEWRGKGVDLDAYNTEESADDLEDLRKALGAEKISLWSISYGTHLAMSMMRRHPDSVAYAILAGPEGPDHTLKLPSDGEGLLRALERRIQSDPAARAAFPDFLGDLAKVLGGLEKSPRKITVPDGAGGGREMLVGAFDVQMLAAGMLRGPETMKYLPGAFQAMANGIFEPVAPYLPRGRSGEIYPMSAAMDAASGISPRRWARIAEEARKTLLADAINFPSAPLVEGLAVRDLGGAFRAPLETSIPTLFISGTFDGRTPLDNAEDLLPGFRRVHHLILEGAGHSDPLFLSSPKILDRMQAFLAGEKLPAEIRIEVAFPAWFGLAEGQD